MAKASQRSSSSPTTLDGDFIVISFNDENGRIDAAAFYRSPIPDAYRGGQSRAFVAGSKKFQVFRLAVGERDVITFTHVEKDKAQK